MTDRHRQLADDIVERLKNKTTLSRTDIKPLDGETREVLSWLSNADILKAHQYGYTKGQKFYLYSGLENILNPPKETPTVNLVEPKKSRLETIYKYVMIITATGMFFFAGLTLSRETKYNKVQGLLDTVQAEKSTLTERVRVLENERKFLEKEKSLLLQAVDSLTKN